MLERSSQRVDRAGVGPRKSRIATSGSTLSSSLSFSKSCDGYLRIVAGRISSSSKCIARTAQPVPDAWEPVREHSSGTKPVLPPRKRPSSLASLSPGKRAPVLGPRHATATPRATSSAVAADGEAGQAREGGEVASRSGTRALLVRPFRRSSLVVSLRGPRVAHPGLQQSVPETMATFPSRTAWRSEREDRREGEPNACGVRLQSDASLV